MDYKELGNRVREARTIYGITQSNLAERVGLSLIHIQMCIRDRSFQIVEDSYKLGIVDDASAYDGNIYEQKNAGGIQYLTLYYVNHEASGRQGKMHLVMNDAKTGTELINIKTSPKVKKDARRYEYRGKDLYVSEEGILLDAGTDEEFYNSQAMTAGLMTVCWKNGKEKQIQFDPNADVAEYEAADIIIPRCV